MTRRLVAVKMVLLSVMITLMPTTLLAQSWDDSVVRLFVTKREVDQTSPWQYEEVRQSTFHGVVVDSGAILTTAYAVENAVEMDMLRFGESRKFDLSVRFVDYEINLALLVPEDPAALKNLRPVTFTDEVGLDSAVTVLKARDNNQLISVAATLQEVGIYSSVTSEYSFATYLLKTQQSALGWSEPLVRGNALVGLGSGQDSQYLHAIPGSLINQFLRDVKSGDYKGFPSVGIELDRLTSPEMRRMLGADGTKNGIRIANVQKGTNFSDLLAKDDVLLAIDGTPVNENGYYLHPLWGKVHLKYLLNRKRAGDKIRLEILRQGERKTVEASLTRFDSNSTRILSYRSEPSEPHVIFGGVVLRELSVPFLKQWGKDWRDTAPYQMLYEYHFANDFVPEPEKDRIVILSRVLADEFNRGYADLKNAIVRSVNGLPVRSLADVTAALRTPVGRGGRQFARIVLAYEDGEIVLSYDGLAEAHARIAATYNISTPSSFFSM